MKKDFQKAKVGLIGLGTMGGAVARRLISFGVDLIVYDSAGAAKAKGVDCLHAKNIQQVCLAVDFIWVMVPAGIPIETVTKELAVHARPGMIIIDAGNSNYHKTVQRNKNLALQGIELLDCGTSGGVDGEAQGWSLMVGGSKKAYEKSLWLLDLIAEGPEGHLHVGLAGAGHFVKMVHNGIEYALLQSYSEGLHLIGQGPYQDLNLQKITQVWQKGSIVRSWINQLCSEILSDQEAIAMVDGRIEQNMTGRWTLDAAIAAGVPTPLIKAAVEVRDSSLKGQVNFATQCVALLRNRFGNHAYTKIDKTRLDSKKKEKVACEDY